MLVSLLLLTLQVPKIEPSRTVFVRGEIAKFSVTGGAKWNVGGFFPATGAAYTFETARLAPGDYTLQAEAAGQIGALKITLVDPPNPGRFALWKWGGTAPRSFAYFAERGFTGAGSPMITAPLDLGSKAYKDIVLSADQAARYGLDYGLYLNPLLDPRWKTDPASQAERFDGAKLPTPYPRTSRVIDHAVETATWVANRFAEFPAWKQALLGSEFQLDSNFSPEAARLGLGEAGVDIRTAGIVKQPASSLPMNGLIDDMNPRYRYLGWWFHRGIGDAALNEKMAAAVRAKRKDVITWHDPYRLAPVSDSAEGLDAISTWTYPHPDMTRMLYTRVLQAAARKSGQKVMQTVTLFLYPRFVEKVGGSVTGIDNDRPGGNDYYTAGPDLAKEALWLAFSQRPDILGVYYGGLLQPDDPAVDKGRASPETFDAIADVTRRLIEPFGPAIRAGRPMPAKVAVLLSAAALWLGDSPRNVGYPNEQILPYLSLLAMNHIPFEVILDEDVVSGGLSRYSVLVMPQAGAVTQSMAAKIRQFVSAGGKVVADKALSAEIPASVKTDYDFTFQKLVDGVELNKGSAITAEENRKRMEALAADLRSKFPPVDRFAEADSPRAIVNVVESGPVKYVFVVNDNRGFGPRFGSAHLLLDRGLPLTTKVTIRTSSPVFDALTGKQVGSHSGGLTVIDADLPAAEGGLYVVLPSAPATPHVEVGTPEAGQPCMISVKTGPLDVELPVRIEVLDPAGKVRLNWAVATSGGIAASFLPAENDPKGTYTVRATELVTQKAATTTFAR